MDLSATLCTNASDDDPISGSTLELFCLAPAAWGTDAARSLFSSRYNIVMGDDAQVIQGPVDDNRFTNDFFRS